MCGQLRLETPDGANIEGALLALRDVGARAGVAASSITAGNGAIYAVRRDAYVEDDPKFGHDFGFPYLMEQAGLRAVYEPEAVAVEKPASEPEDEYGRKVRTIARSSGTSSPAGCSGRRGRCTWPSSCPTACCATRAACSTSAAARLERRARSAAAPFYRRLPRAPARRPRARGRRAGAPADPGRAARLLLLRRDEGDGRRARPLPAVGDAADVGQGQGDAVNRAADVSSPAPGLVADEPAARRSPRSRPSSRTAGRSSIGRPASARTARTSRC